MLIRYADLSYTEHRSSIAPHPTPISLQTQQSLTGTNSCKYVAASCCWRVSYSLPNLRDPQSNLSSKTKRKVFSCQGQWQCIGSSPGSRRVAVHTSQGSPALQSLPPSCHLLIHENYVLAVSLGMAHARALHWALPCAQRELWCVPTVLRILKSFL